MTAPLSTADAKAAAADPDSAIVAAPDPRSEAAQIKAAVLREALPFIQRFAGDVVVVKYGGNAMIDEELKRSFAADMALLHAVGLRPVIVHGGGPQISALAERLDVGSHFVAGLRVTNEPMLDVVRMALLGQVNPELVGLVQRAGGPAVGISGTDAGLLTVRPAVGPNGEDLGRVGEVTAVDPKILLDLLDDGMLPVVATLGRDASGLDRNVNADLAAGQIAAALGARKLVYLTDVPGLYLDFGDEGSLVSEMTLTALEDLFASGSLHTGMLPKVRSIVQALADGVPQAHILDGRVLHAVLLEIFTDAGIGTMITPAAVSMDQPEGSA